MTTPNVGVGQHDTAVSQPRTGGAIRRVTTETKNSLKTSEFWAFLAVVAGILVSAAAIKGGDDGTDQFIARHAWLYISIVTAGYMISRGLAKSGSYEPDRDNDWDGSRG
jgi:hypothetical protein